MDRVAARAMAPSTAAGAHDFAMSVPIGRVVKELIELLGAPLVAAVGGVSETRAVQQWQVGRQPQRPQVLRFALQVALMIASSTETELARAWFLGSNPHLDDLSPAQVLRDSDLPAVQQKVMAAARAFVGRETE